MEKHIKQILQVLAKIGQSNRVALLKITQKETGFLLGALIDNKLSFPRKVIKLKNTPIADLLDSNKVKHAETYPCTLIDGYPFPIYNNRNIALQCLCLPLYSSQNRLQAVLLLAREGDNISSFYNLHILEWLQDLLSTSFEIALENNVLSKQITIDSFTGLHSHHYFEKRLQEEFVRCERHGGALSILMIDIDYFQVITAKLGYQQSRNVLQEVSKVVLGAIRQEIDIPCRYGTSQIILLLPNTNVDGAMVVAERIRERCAKMKLCLANQKTVNITVSIGVAHNIEEIHDPETVTQLETIMDTDAPYSELSRDELKDVIEESELSKEDLLYRAEVMLSAAHQAGHNQVMVWW